VTRWRATYRLKWQWLLLGLQLALQAALVAADDSRRALLWEISGPGQPVSYLFGTIHSESPAVLKLAPPVQQAFDAAQVVVLEVLLDGEAMLHSSRAMLLEEGRRLSQLAGASLFERAARAGAARGIPEVVLERMKPWAVAVTLSMPAAETGMVLDLWLYEQALQAGKRVHGLESIGEQLGIFDDLPETRQLELLRSAVDHFPAIDAMHAELLAAWQQRDLDRLQAISDAALQDEDRQFAADFEQRLIIARNRLMAERVQAYLRAGNAFVAVGALHLPGEEGLLALLQGRGYTLRPVY